MLRGVNKKTLTAAERAMLHSVTGEVFFSMGKYERAVLYFRRALSDSNEDTSLMAHTYLNLAKAYFEMGLARKSYSVLKMSDYTLLLKEETRKYHKLMYRLSHELGKDNQVMISLVHYLGGKKTIHDLKNDPYFEYLLSNFSRQSLSDKWHFFEQLEDADLLPVAYLAYLEMEKLYYKGEKDQVADLFDWMDERFKGSDEIRMMLENFQYRMENYTRMNPNAIGVLLPLSGRQKRFGRRALQGIDSGLKSLKKRGHLYQIYVRDTQGSGAVGAFQIRQLIEKYHVSIIVGGLFSSEAVKEYLEAKRYGVFYISLSQIYLPREEKDHLLLEIPGSVESQLHKLFSPEILNNFGRRAAIIYPQGARGEAYVNEFWRLARIRNVKVTDVLSYGKNQTDFRDPVRTLLGLRFTRSRQEELDILTNVHSLERQNSIRRIQTLGPQVDFDWVYLPTIPKEALQLIPSFAYFDAFDINFFGVPGWRSRSLSREGRKLGRLYFIGDDIHANKDQFIRKFMADYKRRPKLIEMRAFDSISLIHSILKGKRLSSRSDLDRLIRNMVSLEGMTGRWNLNEKFWIKEMVSLVLEKGKISNLLVGKVDI